MNFLWLPVAIYEGDLPTSSPTYAPSYREQVLYFDAYGSYGGDWYDWNVALHNSSILWYSDHLASMNGSIQYRVPPTGWMGFVAIKGMDTLGYPEKNSPPFQFDLMTDWQCSAKTGHVGIS